LPIWIKVGKSTSRRGRKKPLLLNKAIEHRLNGNQTEDKMIRILSTISKKTLDELRKITTYLLSKAGLIETNELLKTF
jgi:hypothetical protein